MSSYEVARDNINSIVGGSESMSRPFQYATLSRILAELSQQREEENSINLDEPFRKVIIEKNRKYVDKLKEGLVALAASENEFQAAMKTINDKVASLSVSTGQASTLELANARAEFAQTLAAKDAVIASQHDEISELKAACAKSEQALAAKDAVIAAQHDEISRREETRAAYRQALAAQDARITGQYNENSVLHSQLEEAKRELRGYYFEDVQRSMRSLPDSSSRQHQERRETRMQPMESRKRPPSRDLLGDAQRPRMRSRSNSDRERVTLNISSTGSSPTPVGYGPGQDDRGSGGGGNVVRNLAAFAPQTAESDVPSTTSLQQSSSSQMPSDKGLGKRPAWGPTSPELVRQFGRQHISSPRRDDDDDLVYDVTSASEHEGTGLSEPATGRVGAQPSRQLSGNPVAGPSTAPLALNPMSPRPHASTNAAPVEAGPSSSAFRVGTRRVTSGFKSIAKRMATTSAASEELIPGPCEYCKYCEHTAPTFDVPLTPDIATASVLRLSLIHI